MSDEDGHPKKTRRVSPAVAMRIRLRTELEPFYRDMGLWNKELASLTEKLGQHPQGRAELQADLSRLRRAVQLGRNDALRRAEKFHSNRSESIIEDADRASSLLLDRIEKAMRS